MPATMPVRPEDLSSTTAPSRCACTEDEREQFLGWVGRLVHEHRQHLVRLARREGLGPEDAFDAVQEAFRTFLTLPAARALSGASADSRKLLVVVTRNVAPVSYTHLTLPTILLV